MRLAGTADPQNSNATVAAGAFKFSYLNKSEWKL